MPLAAALACIVIAVADGDTLSVRCDPQGEQPAQTIVIRLAEVDAPERAQPWGTRSKQHLADVCFQKPAEVRPQTTDLYGRTISRCGWARLCVTLELA